MFVTNLSFFIPEPFHLGGNWRVDVQVSLILLHQGINQNEKNYNMMIVYSKASALFLQSIFIHMKYVKSNNHGKIRQDMVILCDFNGQGEEEMNNLPNAVHFDLQPEGTAFLNY